MSCPCPTGSGESVLTMAMSALFAEVTRFVAVELLFEAMLSTAAEIVALLVSVVPEAVLELTCTIGVNVALAPMPSEAMVQTMFPLEPTTGGVQLQPAGVTIDTKPVPAGTGMVTETVVAADGPPL